MVGLHDCGTKKRLISATPTNIYVPFENKHGKKANKVSRSNNQNEVTASLMMDHCEGGGGCEEKGTATESMKTKRAAEVTTYSVSVLGGGTHLPQEVVT